MLCQNCQQNEATLHITDIEHQVAADGATKSSFVEQHLCDACAKGLGVPHGPKKAAKSVQEIFKLLQMSAQKVRREPGVTCPDCGMTLAEFRQRGRLGCPKDYDLFGAHLAELVERVHGANHHVGRKPGVDETQLARLRRVNELQLALESAIRAEAYENAARIRDELKTLRGD
ncbi:MAG: UvrB/UvrC motif-containing protein [Planctomycetes bacterium]|nr:UvrB/UvrC motif-containing protein [Planctomycetota bacterium]